MPRSTRLLILFSVFVIAATLVLLVIPNAAQTTIVTPNDMDLTRTQIFVHATETGIAIGTPIPPEIKTATMQSLQATRTAIAITREPDLLTPQTPDAIELTATHIRLSYEQTRASFSSANEADAAERNMTVTFIIQRATQTAAALTANPASGLSTYPTSTPASCDMSLGNVIQNALILKIQTALQEKAGIPNASANVVTTTISNPCGELRPLETLYSVALPVSNIFDQRELIDLTERTLALLQNFPPEPDFGKVTRLKIYFAGDFYWLKLIDTRYANALAAYAEGLRGDALIEALGGILDG